VWPVATDCADVSSFLPAFGAGEILVWEKWRGAGCTEEDDIGFADVLFDQALVFAILGTHAAEGELRIRVPQILPFGGGVDFLHQSLRAGEGAVDDVDVVDFAAAEHEC